MKSPTLAKIAASAFVLGTMTTGCTPAGQAARPASVSEGKLSKVAVKAAARANKAIAAKDFATAIGFAESAVAAMPRDAGYRMLLGQAYLGAGRFASAETSFMDALTLDPEQGRAALNLALVEVAVGKKADALETLADYRDKIAAPDYGLAVALAGDVASGVVVLETASRAEGADAKTRQNLALVYAMAGKWNNARVMATQDLPPVEADARIIQWMSFVRPEQTHDQVAQLLGVTPVEDDGQPTRLALAPAMAPVAVAAAAIALPTPEPVTAPILAAAPAFETAPVVVAKAEPAPVVPIVDAPPAVFAAAAARRAMPEPAVSEPVTVRSVVDLVKAAFVPAPKPQVVPVSKSRTVEPGKVEPGKFVVQLGAFSSLASAQGAWDRVSARYQLTGYDPVSGQATVKGANYVRLSVGGFANRAEAVQVCVRIQKAGGSCFVRGLASDAPAQWVKRSTPNRLASR